MNTIKLRYLSKGKRRTGVDMHGFEGPAKKPLNDVLSNGGQLLRRGEITTAYTLYIPPSNICEVVDTQYNRERLRKMVKSYKVREEVNTFDEETHKPKKEMRQVTIDPAFEVLSDIDIFEDIAAPEKTYTHEEVQAMIKDAVKSKGEPKKGESAQKVKSKKTEIKKGPMEPGVVAEDKLPPENVSKDRFANKVMPRDMSPIK